MSKQHISSKSVPYRKCCDIMASICWWPQKFCLRNPSSLAENKRVDSRHIL